MELAEPLAVVRVAHGARVAEAVTSRLDRATPGRGRARDGARRARSCPRSRASRASPAPTRATRRATARRATQRPRRARRPRSASSGSRRCSRPCATRASSAPACSRRRAPRIALATTRGCARSHDATVASLQRLGARDAGRGRRRGVRRQRAPRRARAARSRRRPSAPSASAATRAIPASLDAGTYDVVLEPEAVAELLEWLATIAFGAPEVEQGTSPLAGRLGERITGEGIDLVEDPLDSDPTLGFGVPFDREGTWRRRVPARRGRRRARDPLRPHLRGPRGQDVHRQRAPARRRDRPAASAPPRCRWAPGPPPSVDELLAGIDRGLYVCRLHYVNGLLEPRRAVMTGLTRDGCFLVEKGRSRAPSGTCASPTASSRGSRGATAMTRSPQGRSPRGGATPGPSSRRPSGCGPSGSTGRARSGKRERDVTRQGVDCWQTVHRASGTPRLLRPEPRATPRATSDVDADDAAASSSPPRPRTRRRTRRARVTLGAPAAADAGTCPHRRGVGKVFTSWGSPFPTGEVSLVPGPQSCKPSGAFGGPQGFHRHRLTMTETNTRESVADGASSAPHASALEPQPDEGRRSPLRPRKRATAGAARLRPRPRSHRPASSARQPAARGARRRRRRCRLGDSSTSCSWPTRASSAGACPLGALFVRDRRRGASWTSSARSTTRTTASTRRRTLRAARARRSGGFVVAGLLFCLALGGGAGRRRAAAVAVGHRSSRSRSSLDVGALFALGAERSARGRWTRTAIERPLLKRHGFWVVVVAAALLLPRAWASTRCGIRGRRTTARSRARSSRATTGSRLWWAQDGWFWCKPVLDIWMQAHRDGHARRPLPARQDAHRRRRGRRCCTPSGPCARRSSSSRSSRSTSSTRASRRPSGGARRSSAALVLATMPDWFFLAHQTMTDMPFVAPMTACDGPRPPRPAHARRRRGARLRGEGRAARAGASRRWHLVFGAILVCALPQILYLALAQRRVRLDGRAARLPPALGRVPQRLGRRQLRPARQRGVHAHAAREHPARRRATPRRRSARRSGASSARSSRRCRRLLWAVVLGVAALPELGRAARAAPLLPRGLVLRGGLDDGARARRASACPMLVTLRVPRASRPSEDCSRAAAHRARAHAVRDRQRAAHHPRGGAALVRRDVRAPRAAVHRPADLPRHVQPRVPPRARHQRGRRHELPLLRVAARLRALPVDGPRAARAPRGGCGGARRGRRASAATPRCSSACGSSSRFALFSFMGTKFHHYIFPAVPPVAMLIGVVLDDMLGKRRRSTRRGSLPRLPRRARRPASALAGRSAIARHAAGVDPRARSPTGTWRDPSSADGRRARSWRGVGAGGRARCWRSGGRGRGAERPARSSDRAAERPRPRRRG